MVVSLRQDCCKQQLGPRIAADGADSRSDAAPSVGTTAAKARAPGQAAATIGMTCIAILAQRSSDKSPAVRAKALASLAAVASAELSASSPIRLTQLREVRTLSPS